MRAGDTVRGRFQIERLAAQGGMGAVWRARDLHTDELAAVKVVRVTDARSLERFAREARVLAELRHPGIVQYLGHGRTDAGELYLAMEWLDGEDLGARLDARELTLAESLHLAMHVAAALAVAHARQIVHRDIKPSNLFLADYRPDLVKVLDFGVARLARLETLTETGFIVGTPRYMAPEQARGSPDVDARADVFALGAVLYRCLTGRLPFTGETPAAALHEILEVDPPPVAALRPDLPAALDRLVMAMLAKDRDRRPRDAAALVSALLGFDLTPAGRGAAPAAAELTEEERRLQCVLLVGAPMSDGLAEVAAAHGGVVEPAGDATVVALASSRVATDQARQAARCALALRALVPSVPMALVSGRRPLRAQGAGAEPVARARELAARGEGVRVDEVVAGLLDARFAVDGDGGGLVLRAEQTSEDERRTLLGAATPFVGREAELAQLEAVVDAAEREGEARAVLVTAAPGVGKSRLRQELAQRLRHRDVAMWVGRGDPMRAGAPFGLLGEVVRRAAGIVGTEAPEAATALLEARVAARVAPGRARHVAEFLGEIAGVPFPAAASVQLRSARKDPRLLGDQARAAFIEWLGAECQAAPVLLVFEDLHWGDVSTVRLVDAALQALAELPLVVLGLARPEVDQQFPGLWAERGLQRLHLAELSRKAAERLVRRVLGAAAPAATVARVVELGAGNAFFLEELIRQAATGAGAGEGLPATVLAMLDARLEALPAEARRVLRAASVFGEVFWSDGVQALLGEARPGLARQWLDDLHEREIVRRRLESRFAGTDELVFRHGLVREAAYAMLTDADRALGHRLAGAWLERAGEREALPLAEHFERGGDGARAAGFYERAAASALAGNDLTSAHAHAERAVACGATGELLARLRLVQAEAARWGGDNPVAERRAEEAMAAVAAGSPAWFAAAGERIAAAGKRGRVPVMAGLCDELVATPAPAGAEPERAVALARAATQCALSFDRPRARVLAAELHAVADRFAGDPRVAAWIEGAFGYTTESDSLFQSAIDHHEASGRRHEEVGDLRNACLSRLNCGDCLMGCGAHDRALRIFDEVMPLVDAMGLVAASQLVRACRSFSLGMAGRSDEARAVALEALGRLAPSESPRTYGLSLCALGEAQAGSGDWDGVADTVAKLRPMIGEIPIGATGAVLLMARLDLHHGRFDRVAERMRRELEGPVPPHPYFVVGVRGLLALALHALGAVDEARARLAQARDELLANQARFTDAELRQAYVAGVPHHVHILETARLWNV